MLKLHQAENLVMQPAVKYVLGEDDNDDTGALHSDLPVEIIDKPDNIITETFSL